MLGMYHTLMPFHYHNKHNAKPRQEKSCGHSPAYKIENFLHFGMTAEQ